MRLKMRHQSAAELGFLQVGVEFAALKEAAWRAWPTLLAVDQRPGKEAARLVPGVLLAWSLGAELLPVVTPSALRPSVQGVRLAWHPKAGLLAVVKPTTNLAWRLGAGLRPVGNPRALKQSVQPKARWH
ncbi:hypothetical protein CAOG_009487 [Capsaspora owczarzaki ATCC 30864]|uniref:Uncharacterized protein n=1 Tax=Capsaspora owczarzaki (strain ATCC 30864) TaxID=595528 RepID=A0A0D2X1G8_CAPO3|nr:hypothetical protein CAOG_009487 [Capsaspora owczarzaki ATCC 30864]